MIKDILDIGEQIVWEGKSDKVTYIVGAPMMYIFALLWGAFDSRRIYIESGMIGRDVKIIEFSDVHEPEVNVGVIEKLRDCGSVRLSPGVYSNNGGRRGTSTRTTLAHIADPYRVYKIIKQMALDIKSDILYPNALRPDENPGYDTKYRPD